MEIVNAVYKTRLGVNLDLYRLAAVIPDSILYVGRPTQLKVKLPTNKITCLLFGRGGLRIMGKGVADASQQKIDAVLRDILSPVASCLSSEILASISSSSLELQTLTVVTKLPSSINLYRFIKVCECQSGNKLKPTYDFELFSAVRLENFRPVSVNVFSSGKIIMCGIKNMECADCIYKSIMDMYIKL